MTSLPKSLQSFKAYLLKSTKPYVNENIALIYIVVNDLVINVDLLLIHANSTVVELVFLININPSMLRVSLP